MACGGGGPYLLSDAKSGSGQAIRPGHPSSAVALSRMAEAAAMNEEAASLRADAAPHQRSYFKRHTGAILVISGILAGCHYTFGESVFSPGISIWRYQLFWRGLCLAAILPFGFWAGWKVVSFRSLKPEGVIL